MVRRRGYRRSAAALRERRGGRRLWRLRARPAPCVARPDLRTTGRTAKSAATPRTSPPDRMRPDDSAARRTGVRCNSIIPTRPRRAHELEAGLLGDAGAHISPKFLYDALGSKLFEAITELPEYYPTRTEAAIFARHGAEMARAHRRGRHAGRPRRRQLRQGRPAVRPAAAAALRRGRHLGRFPARRAARLPASIRRSRCRHRHRLLVAARPARRRRRRPAGVLLPGLEHRQFHAGRGAATCCAGAPPAAGGGLLVGVDLVKPRAVLEAAYDDALGVTAAFNLNLLRNLNRLIGSDFEPRDWRHVALLQRRRSRASRCTSKRARRSTCAGPAASAASRAGERIHTENSYKYTIDGLRRAAARCRLRRQTQWHDDAARFAGYWTESALA